MTGAKGSSAADCLDIDGQQGFAGDRLDTERQQTLLRVVLRFFKSGALLTMACTRTNFCEVNVAGGVHVSWSDQPAQAGHLSKYCLMEITSCCSHMGGCCSPYVWFSHSKSGRETKMRAGSQPVQNYLHMICTFPSDCTQCWLGQSGGRTTRVLAVFLYPIACSKSPGDRSALACRDRPTQLNELEHTCTQQHAQGENLHRITPSLWVYDPDRTSSHKAQ